MKIIKTLLPILILSGIYTSAECQKSAPKEKIKSIIVLEEKHDMLVKKQYKESETYFDIKGNVIEEITYKQGKVNKHFRYQYDQDDNKIKEEELDQSGRIIESSEYKKSRKTYQYSIY
jgi:hypothetical protein